MKKFNTMKIKLLASFAVALICASCATTTSDQKFIDDLMSKMTLEEKLGQLNLPEGRDVVSGLGVKTELDSLIRNGLIGGFFNVKGVDKIEQLQRLAIEKGPHGIPLLVGADVVHGYETVFPIPLAMSCSWDTTAIREMARISAIEATADGVNWNYSPMVDICRDPRWGRIAEGSGEDPYLGSEIARAYIKGYQGSDLKSDSTLMACVKHFALYGASEAGRDYNTVDMSLQRMFNYYLPPYKAAVEAGTASVMTSFNLINGTHATADEWLVNDVLRKRWGFDGLIATDYNSLPEVAYMGNSSLDDAAAFTLKAGTDMDMVSGLYLKTLPDALKRGLVTEKMIDQACRRVLEAKQRLGLFDDPYKYCKAERAKTDLFTPEHRRKALELAAESFVLLKNDNDLLPLKRKGRIVLIGPMADAGNNMCGTWSGYCKPELHKSLLDAFKESVGGNADIIYAKGSNVYYDETTQINAQGTRPIERGNDAQLHVEALAAAAKADVVVVAMGECSDMSGESASRAHITIPDTQRDLLKKLSATGKPIVLLLFTGRPLVLDWEQANIPSILNVWYGGSEAADAITQVIFGDKVPSGKLTATFPAAIGQIPIYYNHLMSSHPDPQDGVFNRYASNYIDAPTEPLYPFGFGLSYTTFEYGKLEIDKEIMNKNGNLTVSINVTNTGKYDGTEIVQLYVRDFVAQIARPVKELKGFKRVFIPQGETVNVKFTLDVDDLKYYNDKLEYVYDPGEFEVMVGPNSRDLQGLRFTAE